jgi:CO dehydrogenase nickel-insertion accessory protein CooC1
VTLEPYDESLETARHRRARREIGIPRVVTVADKAREEDDRGAIAALAAKRALPFVA